MNLIKRIKLIAFLGLFFSLALGIVILVLRSPSYTIQTNGILLIMTMLYNDQIDFNNWHYRNDPTHVFIYRKETIAYIANTQKLEIAVLTDRFIVLRKTAVNCQQPTTNSQQLASQDLNLHQVNSEQILRKTVRYSFKRMCYI